MNELLAFEKISAGLFTIEPVQTSLLKFLKKCMSLHFIPALAKEITLEMSHVQYAEIMVSIDPIKMGIVMRNVLANAIKFSNPGGTVTVGVDVKGFENLIAFARTFLMTIPILIGSILTIISAYCT